MHNEPFCVSICDLGIENFYNRKRVKPSGCLEYCFPCAGGWCIPRIGSIVPEAVMLLVSPAGCGRHGAITSIQKGYKNRLFFLHMSESDIVNGQHLDKIFAATANILAEVDPRPKAMMICASCIDDLLGSDYEAIAEELERKHNIPIKACHMDPIAMEGSKPPVRTIQQAIYDFIPRASKKDNAINIIGSFPPLDKDSEFKKIMSAAGIEKIRHIAECSTLEEFYQMGCSSYNIVIKPRGLMAAEYMKKRLDIPFCYAPAAYSIETINRTYKKLEEFLGMKLDTDRYSEKARQVIDRHYATLGPLTVVVGEIIENDSTYELARALIEYGFKVPYIIANRILDIDLEHINWLKTHAPDIVVFTNAHPSMTDFLQNNLKVDIAIGMDAAYFFPHAKPIPLRLDTQLYGYKGIESLLELICQAFDNPQDIKKLMYGLEN